MSSKSSISARSPVFRPKRRSLPFEAAMRSEVNSKKSRRQVVEDFCWALLNSQEFMNH